MSVRRLSKRKLIVFTMVLGLIVMVPVEIGSYFACRFLEQKSVFYDPQFGDYAEYLRIHDPILGWPAPTQYEKEGTDPEGARLSPSFPDRAATPPVISCYGDSFTWSAEVDDAHAWPEVLGTMLGVRVDNFGVGGYGSDQALIRFRQKTSAGIDRAPIVIFTHLSENIQRNLNQFRELLYPGTHGVGFKPRFVLDDAGALSLVPLPLPAPEQYDAFIRNPARYLEHEVFTPGAPDGPRIARFPYTASVVMALTHPRLRAALANEPNYLRFFDPNHPAHGTQLTGAIMEAFYRDATAMGRIPVPIIIPTGLDLVYFQKHNRWTYAPLLEELRTRGVPVLDVGPYIEEHTRGQNLADFFALGRVSSHFNDRGYRLVADALRDHLKAMPEVEALLRDHASETNPVTEERP